MNRISTIVLSLGLGAAAAAAQVPDGYTGPWTLQQCIDYAVANNLQIKQKELTTQQAEVDLYGYKGQLWPSLSFATNQAVSWRPWSSNYVDVSNGTMTSTSSEVNYNGTYGLTAQWTVWNGGRSWKNVERAKKAIEQDRLDTDITALSLQEQIIQVYVQILYQTEAVKVNEEILASTKTLRDRTAEMVEVGTMARADLAQMDAQVSQGEYNVVNAKTQLEQFKLQLKQLLEIVDGRTMTVADPNVSDATVLAALPARADVYQQALTSRPEIAYNQMGIELADMDIDLARRQKWPTIGMSAGINTSNSSGMHDSFFDQLKTNLSNQIGVSVSVPIFDNRSASTATKRARLQKESAQLSLQSAQKEIFNSVETYWLNAYNGQEQYRAALANVAAMQESYTLVSEQYAVGLKDVSDLTTGKDNLIEAEQQLLQSKYTAVLNRALLLWYGGEELSL